jgi:hypothetical protein
MMKDYHAFNGAWGWFDGKRIVKNDIVGLVPANMDTCREVTG